MAEMQTAGPHSLWVQRTILLAVGQLGHLRECCTSPVQCNLWFTRAHSTPSTPSRRVMRASVSRGGSVDPAEDEGRMVEREREEEGRSVEDRNEERGNKDQDVVTPSVGPAEGAGKDLFKGEVVALVVEMEGTSSS